jgi:F0F1-type ATP synthase assembly protein I
VAKDDTDLKQAMFQVSDGVIGAAILIVIGIFGGQWLDTHFHTAPICMITLSMIGGGLGLARLVKKAMLIGQDSPKPDSSKMIDLNAQNEGDKND